MQFIVRIQKLWEAEEEFGFGKFMLHIMLRRCSSVTTSTGDWLTHFWTTDRHLFKRGELDLGDLWIPLCLVRKLTRKTTESNYFGGEKRVFNSLMSLLVRDQTDWFHVEAPWSTRSVRALYIASSLSTKVSREYHTIWYYVEREREKQCSIVP